MDRIGDIQGDISWDITNQLMADGMLFSNAWIYCSYIELVKMGVYPAMDLGKPSGVIKRRHFLKGKFIELPSGELT